MVFRHEGGLVFDTMVFNPSACEKVYPTFDIKKEDEALEKAERRDNKSLVVENINGVSIYRGQKAAKAYATSSQTKHTSFVVLLRRFHVKYATMIIPRDFVRSNGLSGKNCKAVLRDPKGRTWPVNLIFSKADGRISIGRGWRAFATSNCLKEEDVCIFKLICSRKIHKGGICLDVMVLDANMCGRQYRQAYQTEPMHPFFVIHLEKHNLNKSVLHIPKSFATFCGLKGKISEGVLKDQKGRAWPVKLKSRLYCGVDIVAGWLEFSAANLLKEEDICIFRLISSGKIHDGAMVFDVTVLDYDMKDVQPRKPCFTISIRPSILDQSCLYVPGSFTRSNDLKESCELTLTDRKGISWQMKLKHRNGSGRVGICGSWRKISVANGFKVGDFCTFELLKMGKMVELRLL
ncbi:putative B3 domain-containing protein REM15 [Macadamia integrifolia]|uniref:putative B3 domain-containing protein REM15 n=1 Tax=Macadamia integrifolia TaxID=60698 RepID=UPI001C4E9CFC|nr:putative B3 domain-containing protein REM15 [Macadamia integrifolia]